MSLLNRTFHPDEANQAFTTGRLLESGVYRYDPKDHHGPTLYYAAAAIQKAAGNDGTAALDGNLLRCTPLLFAVLTLVFTVLTAKKIFSRANIGWKLPSLLIAGLLATSPIFVFFATDFIQEMLLACFTTMMLWAATGYVFSLPAQRLKDTNPPRLKPGTWTLLFGIAAGLAFATKETTVLTFAAFAVSAATAYFYHRQLQSARPPSAIRHLPITLAIAGFALTSILLYSSFASNWQGVYNAFVAAPLSYVHRAVGDAVSEGAAYHVHPWWQYLKWLFSGNMTFTAFTGAGMFLGLYAIVGDRSKAAIPTSIKTAFVAMLALSLSLTVFYSIIPYKTPWCALQMHIPLLAAGFLGLLAFSLRGITGRIAIIVLSTAAVCGNVSIVSAMWKDPDSKQIPYNYASASPQVKDMAKLVRDIVSEKQKAGNTFVAIALPSEDTWPLPFYLRGLDARIGYWTQFAELEALAGLKRNPDIVVVPAGEGHLVQPLFPHLKNTKRFEMRHRVRVRVFW